MVTYPINGFSCVSAGGGFISIVNKSTVAPSGGICDICLVKYVIFVKFTFACHSSSVVIIMTHSLRI